MLKEMRRHAKYFYVLFIIIILSFIFWGIGSSRLEKGNKDEVVADVGGQKISIQDYWTAYDNVEQSFRALHPDQFDDKMRAELKKRMLNELIIQKVLLIAAHKAGLQVSDRELQDAITSDPNFSRNGMFVKEIYLRTLELNHLDPGTYEAAKRQELLANKMRRLVEDPVELSPAEIASLPKDPKTAQMVESTVLGMKKERVLNSYLAGIEKNITITVNEKLTS